jgi:hypothetical protein
LIVVTPRRAANESLREIPMSAAAVTSSPIRRAVAALALAASLGAAGVAAVETGAVSGGKAGAMPPAQCWYKGWFLEGGTWYYGYFKEAC